ncbi:MAG TPA: hypothetical protein VNA28_12005 [Solirubrobacteraceae bacterium]|nr:hypothetical protein [Solirubrobacteraceae bacterium]
MGCLVLLLALISPRLAIVAIWLGSTLLQRAFDNDGWAVIGFFLLPWTTLVYTLAWHNATDGVRGGEAVFVILAVCADLAAWGNSRR